jgi:hypothetical protein
MTPPPRLIAILAAAAAAVAVVAGCGLGVQSPDLFLLTRAGEGSRTTLLINDGGTIRCNDRAPRPLAEQLLLRARDLAMSLDPDAKAKLTIPASANSVFRYTIKLQSGTISFPDTAATRHPELAQVELFAAQAAHDGCGLPG